MQAFWLAMGTMFVAELGDKTQLITLTLACRYSVRVVLAGVFAATLLLTLLSASLGGALSKLLPENWVAFVAGLAFIVFGLWTLRGEGDDEEAGPRAKGISSPFWVVTVTFALAELGDKTMLGIAALAADRPVVLVWLGATVGMVLSNILALLVARVFGKNLPDRAIRIGAACMFGAFGVFSIASGGNSLPVWAWFAGFAALAVCAFTIFRGGRNRAPRASGEKPCETE